MSNIFLSIPGRLPGANEHINACKASPREGNKLKRETQNIICWHIKKLLNKQAAGPNTLPFEKVYIEIKFVERNKKRDLDNIAFATKYIFDALQQMKIIQNDGWKVVTGYQVSYDVDKNNPRIEVLVKNI